MAFTKVRTELKLHGQASTSSKSMQLQGVNPKIHNGSCEKFVILLRNRVPPIVWLV